MVNSALFRIKIINTLSAIAGLAIMLFARLVTAVRGQWEGVEPISTQRVYFANHVSHGDFVLIWTTLPGRLRRHTRPVAGADYWLASKLKQFIGEEVFRAVLIARGSKPSENGATTPSRRGDTDISSTTDIDAERASSSTHAIESMSRALQEGDSLILFPEGTRNTTDERLLPFKSGLYHLAKANSSVEFVPVWIDNLHRVLPKGEFIPVPLACTVTYGEALRLNPNEPKDAFIKRAESALRRTGKLDVAVHS